MNKLKVIELFGGIGSPHKALTKLGIPYEVVDMVEFDAKAVKSYNAVHGTNFEPQNILEWDKDIKVDYLHASTPCQAFSTAGKRLGAEDSRGAPLWEATLKVIQRTKPRIITMENVKGLLQDKHKELLNWYIESLQSLGYTTEYKVLNAKYFGIPQNRERVFLISRNDGWTTTFPENDTVDTVLKDILEPTNDWEIVTTDNLKRHANNLYVKNALSQYTGKTIEINLDKLFNQDSQEINRVARLKKKNFDELDFGTKLDNIGTGDRDDFMGVNGVNVCLTTRSSDGQKVFELEDVDKITTRHQIDTNGVSPTLDTRCDQDPKIIHLEDIPFDSDKTFQGTQGLTGTLLAQQPDFKMKIVELEDLDFNQAKSYNGVEGISGSPQAANDTRHEQKILVVDNCIIKYRKLLPVETWKLMGFTVEDFNKAAQVNSNSQLTKQAGNSIVVNVMEELLKSLLIPTCDGCDKRYWLGDLHIDWKAAGAEGDYYQCTDCLNDEIEASKDYE